MALTSFQFIFFVMIVILAFHASRSVNYRRFVLSIANLVFIGSFLTSLEQVIPLLVFLATGLIALYLSGPNRRALNGMLIGTIIIMFMILKRYAFLGPIPTLTFPYLSIGLSYILFRMLQLVIDRGADATERRLTVREFFDFTCNFLCFISGPIQRSPDFLQDQVSVTRAVDASLAYRSFRRMVVGYIKVMVVSGIANYVFAGASDKLFGDSGADVALWPTVSVYCLAVASYTTYLYFNFSGYMDIVIGFGWLLGEELPENFNRPFRARNLFEFWGRWHMTLSEWFKTYLFNPLVGWLASRWGTASSMPYLGVLAFFVSFFVMGVWHGSTMVFVIYGLVMGAGVIVCKLWQLFMTARLGKKGARRVTEHPIYAASARGITISFFSIAVTALWVDWKQVHQLASKLHMLGLATAFLALAILSGCAFPVFDWIEGRWEQAARRAAGLTQSALGRQIVLGAAVLFIFAVTSFFHKAPEFVYKAF